MTWNPEPSGWRPGPSYEFARAHERAQEAIARLAENFRAVEAACHSLQDAAEAWRAAIEKALPGPREPGP